MFRELLRAKIHRATITGSYLNYEGSISIDEELLEAGDFKIYEKVDIYNVNTGARFSTYVIPAPRGSREIRLNGAAARLGQKGDIIIIASYTFVNEKDLDFHRPYLVYVDEENNIISVKRDMSHILI